MDEQGAPVTGKQDQLGFGGGRPNVRWFWGCEWSRVHSVKPGCDGNDDALSGTGEALGSDPPPGQTCSKTNNIV